MLHVVIYHSASMVLPEDFQTELLSFRVPNVFTSPRDSTLTMQVNSTNLINILYMTFILEQTCCPAFQTPGVIVPSSLFIKSMPKSQRWLICWRPTCFLSPIRKFRRQASTVIQTQLLLDKHGFKVHCANGV